VSAPQFAILGPLEVTTSGGDSLSLGGRKQRELLALLILHRHRPVPASRLITELWGDNPPRGAEVTLRSHISHLRKALTAVTGNSALVTGPAGYRLSLAPEHLDAERYEHLIGLGQEALGLQRPESAAEHIREALRLWRGPAYAELEEVDAARAEAARLAEVRLGALEVLASAELAAGRHRETVAELESLVLAHPFRERLWAHLMVALYRSGRQAEALDAYNRARERLADELGLDPGPELQALAQSILRQDPVLLGEIHQHAPPSRSPRATTRTATHRPPDAIFTAAIGTPLIGRHVELERLDRTWNAAAQGGRRVILISGEAGIGKTRLVAELVQHAQPAAAVLIGRCQPAALPYQPLADALGNSDDVLDALDEAPAAVRTELGRLLGDHDGRPPAVGGTDEQTLYAAVSYLLRQVAGVRPVLLVIDNAERVDPATAALLRHVLERLADHTLVVLSYRDPPGGRHPPLLALLGDTAQDLVERIDLGPLSEPEVAEIVRDRVPTVDGFAREFWQYTGGNPFYATEMASALAGSRQAVDPRSWAVPVGVRDVLRHRLLALSDQARQVLPVAAVLGSEVDFELLSQVSRLSENDVAGALDEAVAAGLLVESGRSWTSSYAFRHELMRDALQSEITGLRRRALHLHAAEALKSRPQLAHGGHAAIARHLRAAGSAADPQEAARYSLLAAEDARTVYAWDEAIEYAEYATEVLGRAGVPPQAQVEAALTAARLRLNATRGFPEAVSLLETALRACTAAGDDGTSGVVHSRLGSALCLHHSVMDIPRALDHFAAAERLLPAPERAFHLHRGRSQAAMFGMRTAQLVASADRAHAIAVDLNRRDLDVVAGWAQGWAALNEGRLADATAIWERSWAAAHLLADPYLGWMPANASSLAATAYLMDPSTARSWCRRGLAQPRFDSFTHPHAAVVDQLTLALALMGELDAAHQAASTLPADAVARRMLIFLDGDWEQAAAAWAAAATADQASGDLHDAVLNLRWLATAKQTLGDQAGAITAFEQALDLSCAGPQLPTELDCRAELVQLLATSQPAEAEQHLARCEEILGAGEDWRGVVGQVELARAAVAAARRNDNVADAAFARAVESFTTFRLPWRTAAALARWGRPDPAAAIYTDLGAAERWRQRLRSR
jgi:DNA-binding SARP family transcriptional activator